MREYDQVVRRQQQAQAGQVTTTGWTSCVQQQDDTGLAPVPSLRGAAAAESSGVSRAWPHQPFTLSLIGPGRDGRKNISENKNVKQ